ncbi:MAG: hypothetical protein U0002_08695 [Thermoanaerobaculia bacterium]
MAPLVLESGVQQPGQEGPTLGSHEEHAEGRPGRGLEGLELRRGEHQLARLGPPGPVGPAGEDVATPRRRAGQAPGPGIRHRLQPLAPRHLASERLQGLLPARWLRRGRGEGAAALDVHELQPGRPGEGQVRPEGQPAPALPAGQLQLGLALELGAGELQPLAQGLAEHPVEHRRPPGQRSRQPGRRLAPRHLQRHLGQERLSLLRRGQDKRPRRLSEDRLQAAPHRHAGLPGQLLEEAVEHLAHHPRG